MGYTHYFGFKNGAKIDAERWNKALELGKACMEASGVIIKGGDGTGEPIINEKEICLNGDGDNGCETFYLESKGQYTNGFCKTCRCPYDIVVCCFLLSFKWVFGKEFIYTSDGTTRGDLRKKRNKEYWAKNIPNWKPKVEDEWSAAYKLFNKVRKQLYPKEA